MFPHLSDDDRLLLIALVAALLAGLFFLWNYSAKKWLEEHGAKETSPTAMDWLIGGQPRKPVAPLRYSERDFQEMVTNALDEVPEEFDKEWKNVAVVVSTDWPSEEDTKRMRIPEGHLVLGTYSGIDRAKGTPSEGSRHVIVIYQPALEQLCGGDKEQLEQQIRKTVQHELAHHLGMTHQKMKEIGL